MLDVFKAVTARFQGRMIIRKQGMKMMRQFFLASIIGVASFGVIFAAEPLKVKVMADRVNLRAKPIPTAEVVGQVSCNDILLARSWGDDWVEIEPPEHVDLWVHQDLVRENEVLTQNVNVRAGPGVNYAVVGKVSPSDAIIRRGIMGEWVKIAPPATASLWISSSLVQMERSSEPAAVPVEPEPPAATIEHSAIATPVEQPLQPSEALVADAAADDAVVQQPVVAVASVQAAPEPAPADVVMPRPVIEPEEDFASDASALPAGFTLLPVAGQGTPTTREGVLRLTGYVFRSPSRYRLITGESDTVCYVSGNQNQLRSLLGRRMRVTGREYWVKGKDQPVLTAERIVLIRESNP